MFIGMKTITACVFLQAVELIQELRSSEEDLKRKKRSLKRSRAVYLSILGQSAGLNTQSSLVVNQNLTQLQDCSRLHHLNSSVGPDGIVMAAVFLASWCAEKVAVRNTFSSGFHVVFTQIRHPERLS
ncbi:hypothetical protein ILYODFUR_033855 [Ilyodon furcidens]|uniref:Uncharacterized protein n=1 Tax=Ilyodon furcidens TaxID=33524 RepID=A0ABV0UNK7_9TELE